MQNRQNPTPLDVQNEFYDNLCDVNWTRFTKHDYPFLKHKIAYAMFGPPSGEGDMNQLSKTLVGYNSREKDSINEIYELIISKAKYSPNEEDILLSIVFVVCMRPVDNTKGAWNTLKTRSDVVMWTVPVFAIRRCYTVEYIRGKEPCRVYIDHEARVYLSWRNYLMHNKLPKCHMLVPKDGMYKNQNDEPDLHVVLSPAWNPLSKVVKATDIGSTVLSLGALGCLFVSIPAVVTGGIVAGGIAGVYGIIRSSAALIDRSNHQQSIGLDNPDARGCWLNIGGSAVGIGSSVATKALQKVAAASSGASKTGKALLFTANAFNRANCGINGIGFVNGMGTCIHKWSKHGEAPTPLECFQIGSSLLFFTNSLMSNKTAAQIVSETEAQVIDNYRSSLRSNRHRKVFDKMCKETSRTNGNIIKGISSIENKDDFFASIVKMNKELNKNGVKISFSDGGARLNGQHTIDPTQMYKAGPNFRKEIYAQAGVPLSTSGSKTYGKVIPNPVSSTSVSSSVASASYLPNVLSQLFTTENVGKIVLIGNFCFMLSNFDDCRRTLAEMLSDFSATVWDDVMVLVVNCFERISGKANEILGLIFSNKEKIKYVLDFVIKYIRTQALDYLDSVESDNRFILVLQQFFKNGRLDVETCDLMLIDLCSWIDDSFTRLPVNKKSNCNCCGYFRVKVSD